VGSLQGDRDDDQSSVGSSCGRGTSRSMLCPMEAPLTLCILVFNFTQQMSTTNTVGNRIPANDDADITSYDKHLLLGQSIVTLAILCVYGAATWAARPFLDPSGSYGVYVHIRCSGHRC